MTTLSCCSQSLTFHLPLAPKTGRGGARGFTLVELMAVIVVIGVLSSLVVGAMRGAQQDSIAAKTRGTIAKIDSIINDKMDEYLSKPLTFMDEAASGTLVRLPSFPLPRQAYTISSVAFSGTNRHPACVTPTPVLRERVRLSAVRDSMRMEMPDCPADIFQNGYNRANAQTPLSVNPDENPKGAWSGGNPLRLSTILPTGFVTTAPVGNIVMRLRTPEAFGKIAQRLLLADAMLESAGANAGYHWSSEYPNEELLYLIVEATYIGGSPAIELFAANEIADTDKDGLFEFIDGWGTPIRWLRWPSALVNQVPFNPDPLNTVNPIGTDPYDPAQADMGFADENSYGSTFPFAPNYFPRPLIVSAGPDRRFGIRFFAVDPSTPSAGDFSVANIELPYKGASGPTFNKPAHWPLSKFSWTDPFFPRDNVDARLGGQLNTSLDAVLDPIGVDLSQASPSRPTLIPNPSTSVKYGQDDKDNVSNLVSLGNSL
jgi:prepilin-type N-terminal cleavage/methylation domain-containing protein